MCGERLVIRVRWVNDALQIFFAQSSLDGFALAGQLFDLSMAGLVHADG